MRESVMRKIKGENFYYYLPYYVAGHSGLAGVEKSLFLKLIPHYLHCPTLF